MSNTSPSARAKSPHRRPRRTSNGSMLDAFVYDTTPLQDRLVQTAMAESRAHSDRDVPGSSSKENAQKATRSFHKYRIAGLKAKLEDLDAIVGGGSSEGEGSGPAARGRSRKAQRLLESDASAHQPNSHPAPQNRRRNKSEARAEDTSEKTGPRRHHTY